jgi:hypothetical protein
MRIGAAASVPACQTIHSSATRDATFLTLRTPEM